MKVISYSIVLIILLAANGNAQTGNYILESYNAATALQRRYEIEVNHYGWMLTLEMRDLGNFANLLATWIGFADNEAQGEALRICAETIVELSRTNIDLFADRIFDLQQDSQELHLTVFRQLMEMNIKSEEYSLFYYYHSQRMDERLNLLEDHHIPRLEEALELVYDDWFILYVNMTDCAAEALGQT